MSTIIQKHIYVHVPPPDSEGPAAGGAGEGVQAQKHYKIIFIKAPSPPTYSPAQIAAAQAANQEKTIVYVLVKKPEDHTDFEAPSSGPAVNPSKPEVYFIKYKTQPGAKSNDIPLGESPSSDSGVSVPAPLYGPAQ